MITKNTYAKTHDMRTFC